MYFHKNINLTLFFEGLTITSSKDFLLATLFFALLTVIYEATSSYQKYLNYSLQIKQERLHLQERLKINTKYKRLRRHLLCGSFYVINLLFSYILMLLVMSYQIYFLLTVLAGSAIGYFIFNPIILRGIDKLYMIEMSKIEKFKDSNPESIAL